MSTTTGKVKSSTQKKLLLLESLTPWGVVLPGKSFVLLFFLTKTCLTNNADAIVTSCRTLAADTGVSKTTVCRWLQDLEAAGIITRQDRDARFDETTIRLCYDVIVGGPKKPPRRPKKTAKVYQFTAAHRRDEVLQPPSEDKSSSGRLTIVSHSRLRAAARRREAEREAAKQAFAARSAIAFPRKTGTTDTVVDAPRTLDAIHERVAATNVAREDKLRRKREAKGHGEFNPVRDFERRWRETYTRVYGAAPIWSAREWGQAKNLLRWFPEEGADMAVWVLENWEVLAQRKFSWMKDRPITCTIGFVSTDFASKKLHSAWYGEVKFRDTRIKALHGDRDAKIRMIQVEQGLSREEAMYELGRKEGIKEKPKTAPQSGLEGVDYAHPRDIMARKLQALRNK